MKKIILILQIIFFCFNPIIADTWLDPSWKDMINKSDVIALVEYTSNGDFIAKAKPLVVYKRNVNEEIWISGFSNRFGPIDSMNIGDKYIVFLQLNKTTKQDLKLWKEWATKDKTLSPFYEAKKTNNLYYVASPTSGDLNVKKDSVQYSLIKTTFRYQQKYYPLKEFENFLYAATKKISKQNIKKFHKTLLEKIKLPQNDRLLAQNIMMLYLSNFKAYLPIFEIIGKQQKLYSCYALVKLLGNIKGNQSRDLLVELLHNKNGIVQGEVVRQLSKEKASFIAPILCSHLKNSNPKEIYPNVMNPVQNKLNSNTIEIVRMLGKIKYKPVIPQLLPLLKTNNERLFTTLITVLNQFKSTAYYSVSKII